MDAEQILSFRLARAGLARRESGGLADALVCPASDFSRQAALLALAARRECLTRESYEAAVDGGDVVLAHLVRGAIHATAPSNFALLGRALIADDDDELADQLGRGFEKLAEAKGFAPTAALREVAEATRDALRGGRRLDRVELHAELRERVGTELLPWCKGCGSHHVQPMLWRFATVEAGARLDSERRYLLGKPGRNPPAADAVALFLRFYGPATPGEFASWAGVARSHAERLWKAAEGDLVEVPVDGRSGWLARADRRAVDSPPAAEGLRLIPPGDPFLQPPNRALLVPDAAVRKRLFRPVASPGAVLARGRLAGLWRVRARGKKAEFEVEKLARFNRRELEAEAARIADLRGAEASINVA